MTCWRLKISPGGPITSGDDTRFLVHMSIGAVLLHHFVVNAQQQERCSPLADKQSMVILARALKDEGTRDRGKGRSQEKAGGQFGGVALHQGGGLIFRYLSGAYAIIHD